MHGFGIGSVFIVLGFRFYLPFLVGGVVVFFINKPAFVTSVQQLGWKKPILAVIFLLVTGGILYLVEIPGLWKKADPENFFELGLSSVFDLPIYIIWNMPQFLLLYVLLGIKKSFAWIFISFLTVLLLCGADIYFALLPLKTFPLWGYPVLAAALMASIFLYKSVNAIEFSVWMYMAIWMPLLLWGTKSESLVKIFFAKNFTEWDGMLTIKLPAPAMLVGALFLFAMLPVLLRKRKK